MLAHRSKLLCETASGYPEVEGQRSTQGKIKVDPEVEGQRSTPRSKVDPEAERSQIFQVQHCVVEGERPSGPATAS
jgi:hypothetical protein